jgi:hypothetical protein
VINLHGVSKATCAAVLSAICGFTAGCADAASNASHSPARVAAAHINSGRFCAYQISAATTGQDAEINHYWTPLARSAIKIVNQGKMAVTVPRQHLTRSQRRALRLAEWAGQAFAPKPKLVCVHLPPGSTPSAAGPATVSPKQLKFGLPAGRKCRAPAHHTRQGVRCRRPSPPRSSSWT